MFARMGEMMPPCGVPWKEFALVDEPCFQELFQDALIHWNIGQQPIMADVVKTALDVTFQNPFRRDVFARERREEIFTGVLRTPSFSETKGFPICRCFRNGLQRQSVESLHSAVVHGGDAQWTFFLLVLLLNINSAERTRTIPFICQRQDRFHFLRRRVPENTVHAGRKRNVSEDTEVVLLRYSRSAELP